MGVLRAAGRVQQLAVLQLLAEPLQRVDWLVELHGHGHLGQVLADVVAQDVPQVDVAGVRGRRRQADAPAVAESAGHEVAVGHWREAERGGRGRLGRRKDNAITFALCSALLRHSRLALQALQSKHKRKYFINDVN